MTAQTLASTWNAQAPHLTALDAAARLQWSVIPMYTTKTNSKEPCVKWKELQKSAADETTIKAWETLHHPELWGVVTGAVSGIVTLDFDGEPGRVLVEKYGLKPHRQTGSGGFQQDFKHPGWRVKTVNNKSSSERPWAKQYPGLDIRGDGGLAVIAGRNRKGKYTWLRDPEPDDLSILPEEMRAALGLLHAPSSGSKKRKNESHEKNLLEEALHRVEAEGRNDVGFWLARQLRRCGLSREQAESVMRDYQHRVPPTNAKGEEEEYTVDEALASLASVFGTKPSIILGKQLDEEVDEILEALYAANEPPVIFVRGGCLARICLDENQQPRIDAMDEACVLSHITRAANFLHYSKSDDSFANAHPSAKHAKLVLAQGQWEFPPLEGITEVPLIRTDGTLLDKPGYDKGTRLYYHSHGRGALPTIPSHPTSADVAAATEYIGRFIADFPYVGQADKANTYALLITTIIRHLVRHVPMATITATKQGTGKGLLTDAAALIATGRPSASLSQMDGDEEWDKRLTALLLQGQTFISIDNVEGVLRSPILSKALTMDNHTGRVLGLSKMVTVSQRATWVANGNNIQLGGDMPRRCYPISMAVQVSNPWERSGFVYPDLIASITLERDKIIAALLTMVRGWWVAGKPAPIKKPSRLGTFSEWVDLVGGVLAYAGIDGFLENLIEMHQKSDVDGKAWAIFLEAWSVKFGATSYTTRQLIEELTKDTDFADTLPDPLGSWFQDDAKKNSRKIGKALAKKNGTPFGPKNLRIVQGEDSHSKIATFKVAGFAGFAGYESFHGEKVSNEEMNGNGHSKEEQNEATQTPQTPQTPQDDKCSGCGDGEVEHYDQNGWAFCAKCWQGQGQEVASC